MKKAGKFLSFVLVLVMVFSLCGVSAMAATAENVVQYGEQGGYLALGDSVSRGCGASANYRGEYYNFADRTVPGAFPYRIAQAVGCQINDDAADNTDNNYWPVCFPGQTLASTLDLMEIDDGYYDDVYAHGTQPGHFTNYGYMTRYYGDVCEYAKQASLITIELGMCDVFYRAQMLANMECGENIGLEWIEADLMHAWEGYNYWVDAYPKLLQWIKDNCPNATVVLVGMYNMFDEVTITDDMLLPVGDLISVVSSLMNQNMKYWAAQYGYTFVDISSVETPIAEQDLSIDAFINGDGTLNTHPSIEGNAYIARRVLAALPAVEEIPQCKTNIVVDLGQFTKVDYVMVNGVKVDKYVMKDHVLTVPYKTRLANNLTVAVKQDDGKIALYTYQLVYKDGYTAYRIYGNSDVVGSALKAVDNVKNVGTKLVTSIGGLFKK